MATQANGATEKVATPTGSKPPTAARLRANAPQLRTASAIVEKHEQIFDALEHDRITPKTAEQMGQQLKGIVAIEKLGFQYLKFAWEHRKGVPIPRSPILRDMIGLPARVSKTDGEVLRGLIPEP